jgi:arogenate dehydrogenase (NADP+), plant
MVLRQPLVLCFIVLLWEISLAFSTSHRTLLVRKMKEALNGRKRTLLDSSSDPLEGPSGADFIRRNSGNNEAGKLEALKQLESELASQLAAVRREKLAAIQSRPLTIGIVGFGRFGQFIAKTFRKYGNVVVTSRSDYTDIANSMGATYIPMSDPEAFLAQGLDVIVIAVSIVSFDSTIKALAPYLRKEIDRQRERIQHRSSTTANIASPLHGPLIVDVLSVKEHPRNIMLEHLPEECDILCTHPMFGPDSGKNGWHKLNFVYEKTRIDKVVLRNSAEDAIRGDGTFIDDSGGSHSVHEDSEAHVEGMDRMERFLSIWEEEGCRMVPLSCREHDAYAANSQFITHLVGRVLGSQGLAETPIDTSGFQSVLKLVDTTTADSFDLFYGLYKYNQNSLETIKNLQAAMEDVVQNLKSMEKEEANSEGNA